MSMSDEQLLRYSRQIMLPAMDIEGQEKLLSANALIVGLGGLGSPAAMYLAAAGVGQLTLVDFDVVDLSNLQRQIAHTTHSIGQPKVESAQITIKALNPDTEVQAINDKLDESQLSQQVKQADVVLDCSDNFKTRFLLNALCVKHQVPLVSGAAIRMEAQLSVFDSRDPNNPCYHCLYGNMGEADLSCSENGVLSPLVGVIGSMQALEAIKVLSGMGEPLVGKLMLFDAMDSHWRTVKLKKDPNCSVCG